MTLFIQRGFSYAISMKHISSRLYVILFLAFICPVTGFAQKGPGGIIKAGEKGISEAYRTAQQMAELTMRYQYGIENAATNEIATKISNELAREERRAKKHLPRPPEQLITDILPDRSSTQAQDMLQSLDKLWALQDRHGNHNLSALFIQKYYSQHFGIVSQHLQKLFNKIASLNNRELERRVSKRIFYLAQNRDLLSLAALPQTTTTLSSKAFRLRYLSDIGALNETNFQESQLVLSIERKMSPDPQKDFPLRHVSGHAMITIGQQVYPIYQFNGPLENITMLYRFLLNGKKKQPLTVVFDENSKSMAIYNHDRSVWLRISSHEYSFPERLHIHLNELRTVTFTNCYGVEKTERVNFNLSIPLAVPKNLPNHNVQDFLYQQLIVNPIKFFKGDDNVTIEKRPIF